MGYLFDTNIVSAFLRYNEKVLNKMKEVTNQGGKLFISVITDYEVNRGLMVTKATTKLRNYEFLRGQLEILWIDTLELSKQAAEIHAYLRKKGTPIQDADILIAATALLNDLTVVSDDSDLLRVPHLKVENWLRG
jgi:tRNA(fMet)-specific endonuclease VapC